jgi:uncharacterized protein YbjT (DUF2867 family)
MIFVTGGTGTVGSQLVRELAASGQMVRVLVRTPEKARDIQGPGIEVVYGNLEQRETLLNALAGVERVFLLSADDPRQVELQGNVIETAQQAGVRHIVKLSAYTAAPDSRVSFARWHWQTEEQLKQSGLAYTILRPTLYMQNMVTLFGRSIATDSHFVLPMKDGKVGIIDTRDVAAVAAACLTRPGHEGQTYQLTGPEPLSFQQVARSLTTGLGRPITYIDPPAEAYQQALLSMGMPPWFGDALVALFGIYSTGAAALVTADVQQITGREPCSFDQFVHDYLSAWKE